MLAQFIPPLESAEIEYDVTLPCTVRYDAIDDSVQIVLSLGNITIIVPEQDLTRGERTCIERALYTAQEKRNAEPHD